MYSINGLDSIVDDAMTRTMSGDDGPNRRAKPATGPCNPSRSSRGSASYAARTFGSKDGFFAVNAHKSKEGATAIFFALAYGSDSSCSSSLSSFSRWSLPSCSAVSSIPVVMPLMASASFFSIARASIASLANCNCAAPISRPFSVADLMAYCSTSLVVITPVVLASASAACCWCNRFATRRIAFALVRSSALASVFVAHSKRISNAFARAGGRSTHKSLNTCNARFTTESSFLFDSTLNASSRDTSYSSMPLIPSISRSASQALLGISNGISQRIFERSFFSPVSLFSEISCLLARGSEARMRMTARMASSLRTPME